DLRAGTNPAPSTGISMSGSASSRFTNAPASPKGIACRRLPIGAEPVDGGGTQFRVWAPKARRVDVVIDGGFQAVLDAETGGYFSGRVDVSAGARYRFRLDDGERAYPDPASRYQPEGPHGSSEIINSSSFEWSDVAWGGVTLDGQVIYELHVGTFT